MTLHCAGRLGIISWVYEQRHVIAFELGLIQEKPIAECGTGYFNNKLVIVQNDDASNARPSVVFNAKEINLFNTVNEIDIRVDFFLLKSEYPDAPKEFPSGVEISIFHPPSFA